MNSTCANKMQIICHGRQFFNEINWNITKATLPAEWRWRGIFQDNSPNFHPHPQISIPSPFHGATTRTINLAKTIKELHPLLMALAILKGWMSNEVSEVYWRDAAKPIHWASTRCKKKYHNIEWLRARILKRIRTVRKIFGYRPASRKGKSLT